MKPTSEQEKTMIDWTSEEMQALKAELHRKHCRLVAPPARCPKDIRCLSSQLSGIEHKKGLIVCHPHDQWNRPVFAYGAQRIKKAFRSPVEIQYMGARLWSFIGAPHEIRASVVGISIAHEDRWAARISHTLENLMRIMAEHGPLRYAGPTGQGKLLGRAVWLYFTDNGQDFTQKYPGIVELAQELDYPIVELNLPD